MARPAASPTHYSDRFGSENPVDIVERVLLGTLIVDPSLRALVSALRPGDFRAPARGEVFRAITEMEYLDAPLLMLEMERRKVPPPSGTSGWGGAIGRLLDDTCPVDEAIPVYVRQILTASATRRLRIA